jgi:FkbM family methyltransferase
MTSEAKSPPIWFLLANMLPSYARYRVMNYLEKACLLDDRIIKARFYDKTMKIPMKMMGRNLNKYQYQRISTFADICNRHLNSFDFVDCGAHLGLFSAQFARCSDRIQKLTAIEPNPHLFCLLRSNLQNVRAVEVECVNAAIADFEGRGRLVEAAYDSGVDAMYLVNDPSGDIRVITLAEVLGRRTQSRVAIKVDVEGLEAPVLSGAADIIRSLARVVLFVEIHKTVLERVGMSDVEMLGQIEAIRPLSWVNSDDRAAVNSKYPILDQLKRDKQCDLIGISTTA